MNNWKSIFGSAWFYAVLALCVLAVGVGGSFALFAGRDKPAEESVPRRTDLITPSVVEPAAPEIPAVVVEAGDDKVMELALIENLQREDLTIIEEAMGYRVLMETYGFTQEQVARRMGKSRPVIANALRILNLSPEALNRLEKGELSPGHARVLAGLESQELMDSLAAETVKSGLTVRQLEKLAAQQKAPKKKLSLPEKAAKEESAWGDSGYREMEISLGETLGRKVRIRKGSVGGVLELEFFSPGDLSRLAEKLTK